MRHIMNGSRDTYAVTPEDDARIRELAREKIQQLGPYPARTPQFNIERTGRFAGEKFNLKSRSGRVSSAAPRFTATFFHSQHAEAICSSRQAAVMSAARCWRRLSLWRGRTASRRRK